ncbi:MAG: hypothetical protein KC486_34460, partial [Myxococcales bacterium]|nr:hypothetical protein [Myxococcales bacterium]
MNPARRRLVASIGTIAVHGLPLLTFATCSLGVDVEMPEFEFELTEVEFIDPDQELGEGLPEPEPEPEPEVQPPQPEPEPEPEIEGDTDGAEDEPEPEPEPKKQFGDKKSKVDKLGPANSNFFMLLNAKKTAGLPFAESIIEIMASLPDFQFIIDGGGFHPLRDFNYMVIASPDIRDVSQTFLAVEYKLPQQEMQDGLDRAAAGRDQAIAWEERGGLTMGNPKPIGDPESDWDPRWFVFLDDKVAVYVREEFLSQIIEGPDASKGKTSGNFVANLTRMRTYAAREPKAGMQMQMKDIYASVRMKKTPFTIPDAIEVMAEAAAAPELVVKMDFLDDPAAEQFEKEWKELLPRFIDEKVPLLARGMARGLYEQIDIGREDKGITLRSEFSKTQATLLLDQVASMSSKMLRRTPEEMEQLRKRRKELWEARQGGKIAPSAALEKLKTPAPEDPGANPPTPKGDNGEAPSEEGGVEGGVPGGVPGGVIG